MPIVVTESLPSLGGSAPLIPPNKKFLSLQIIANHIVGVAASPFTGSQQFYKWPGAFWQAIGTFPPMLRADAAEWQAFFISCNGRANPFVLGDPLASTPRGSVPGVATVTVLGQQQANSTTLDTWGWTATQTNILRKMDYFQIPRNYLENPSALDQAPWADSGTPSTVTANFVTAPDGSATADRIVFPGSGSARIQNFFDAPSVVEGQTFVYTVWLRAGSSLTARISLVDRLDGSPLSFVATNNDVALTTSWQRFSVTRTMRLGIDSAYAEINNDNDGAAKTVYAWGSCVYSTTQDARLYASLSDVNSASDQTAAISIFPPLRSAGGDIEGCPIITTNPVGLFRLSKNDAGWTENTNQHWIDMNFEAVEAI